MDGLVTEGRFSFHVIRSQWLLGLAEDADNGC